MTSSIVKRKRNTQISLKIDIVPNSPLIRAFVGKKFQKIADLMDFPRSRWPNPLWRVKGKRGRRTKGRKTSVETWQSRQRRVKLQFHGTSTVGWMPRTRLRFIRKNDDERWNVCDVTAVSGTRSRAHKSRTLRCEICPPLITLGWTGGGKKTWLQSEATKRNSFLYRWIFMLFRWLDCWY